MEKKRRLVFKKKIAVLVSKRNQTKKMSEEERIEKKQQDREEEENSSEDPTTTKPTEWNAETDSVCLDVRAFFEQNPNGPVTQKSTVTRAGQEDPVYIGKTMYMLRTKNRNLTQTPLTKQRLKALQDIPGFQTFLQQPSLTKPKPTPEITHLSRGLQQHITNMEDQLLQLQVAYQKTCHDIAETELRIFRRRSKRARHF